MRMTLLSVFLLTTACGGSLQGMTPAPGPMEYAAAPDSATLVLMRNTSFGGAIKFYVVDANGSFIGGTAKNMHGVLRLPAGEYMLYVIAENTDPVHAVLAPGRTYVIQTRVRMGAWKARVTAAPIRRSMPEFAQIPDMIRRTRAFIPVPAEGNRWAQEHAAGVAQNIAEANNGWSTQNEQWRAEHTLGAEDGLTPDEIRAWGL